MTKHPGREIGERITHELARQDHSIRELAARVGTSTPKVRGCSYGGVWNLVHGKVRRPRPEVVQAVAAVLRVRTQWLLDGTGPRTDEEAARQRLDAGDDPELVGLGQLVTIIQTAVEESGVAEIAGAGLAGFLFDLYVERGPRAFGVEWQGDWSLLTTPPPPGLGVTLADVQAYLRRYFGDLIRAMPWDKATDRKAATHARLASLYISEFIGSGSFWRDLEASHRGSTEGGAKSP